MTSALPPPPSRNAPCPCGSGLRYRECHGALAPVAAHPERSLSDTLAAALAAQRQGQFVAARGLYQAALALDPQHFDALHMLGVVHYQMHNYEVARRLIARARELRPDVVEARRNLRLAERALRIGNEAASYRAWLAVHEAAETAARESLRAKIAARTGAPRLSIVLPTYNSPERWLARCLDSVLAQTYRHWELCIADDASTEPATRRMLADYAARDARIRVVYREHNGHIAAASNSAVAIATAPFIALLDHDDELPTWALAEVALEIAAQPDAALIFSDEDKIDEQGLRFEPYFKPDWNPTLMRAQNAISHLGVYRTDVLRAIGGFREGYEGAQDWDLAMRVAECVAPSAIRHIPRVLYHWRSIATSTARSMQNKSYATTAQDRTVIEHCARQGVNVEAKRVLKGVFLQCDPVGDVVDSATLVVLRRPWIAHEGLAARWRAWGGEIVREVAIVDLDDDTDPALGVDERPLVLGSAGACALNAACEGATGRVLVFVDAELAPVARDALSLFVRHASQDGVGAVGGLVLDAQRCIAGTGYLLDPAVIAASPFVGEPDGYVAMGGRNKLVQDLTAVRLDCCAMRREVFRDAGGLDASLQRTFHDVDFCLRTGRSGLRHLWHPGIVFASPRPLRVDFATDALLRPADAADEATIRSRWGEALARDPAYNPNLASPPELFELASYVSPGP